MCAHEKYNQNTGAGMSTDDGAHIAGGDLSDIVLLLEQSFQGSDILGAIAMTDENSIKISGGLAELLHQIVQGSLSAADFGTVDEMTVVVHVDDGLYIQHGANQCSGSTDAASPLQMA